MFFLSKPFSSLLKHSYFETNIASTLILQCSANQKSYFVPLVRKHVSMFFKRNSRLYGIRPLANQINPVNKHFHSPKKFFCSGRFYVLIWRLLACYRLFFCAYQFIIQVMSVKFREERKSEMDIY